ncbi:uncharacterized protein TNCV_2629191 [Trichonephila clavipes]|uniref:Uncharacterized protein n=1 Tax=Trichonephila clavipes TaxID=2585209 RepID=A0A8X6SF49_TRICX|nr:uncharacterized protein TNCV_2629191 [Trichonephila clavipes]
MRESIRMCNAQTPQKPTVKVLTVSSALYYTLLAIKIATPRRRHATDVKRQEEVIVQPRHEPRVKNWVFCKITSVCTSSSTKFAAAWTLSLETMAAATLDAASPEGASSMHQDSRIHVWRHRGERTLAAIIRHRHTGPPSGVMVRSAIGYTSRSSLVRIDGTLNSARYISCVLRPVALSFIRALRNPTSQQDNARAHIASIIRCCPGLNVPQISRQ